MGRMTDCFDNLKPRTPIQRCKRGRTRECHCDICEPARAERSAQIKARIREKGLRAARHRG